MLIVPSKYTGYSEGILLNEVRFNHTVFVSLIQGSKLSFTILLNHSVEFHPNSWIVSNHLILSSLFFPGLTCYCLHVTVKDDKKFAMLFSSVVLQCQYNTHSIKPPVVQWWYKSYCTDRTRESFTFSETLGAYSSKPGAKSHLECSDKSRTVQIVASKEGDSLKLAKQYKGRDISIINSNVS